MTVARLILLAFDLLRAFVDWSRARGLIAEGEERTIAALYRHYAEDVDANARTREAARRRSLPCLLIASCQTTAGGATDLSALPRSVPCASLEPLRWSRHDTRPTQEQAVALNAVVSRNCGWRA